MRGGDARRASAEESLIYIDVAISTKSSVSKEAHSKSPRKDQ